jgi:hypothetical protein
MSQAVARSAGPAVPIQAAWDSRIIKPGGPAAAISAYSQVLVGNGHASAAQPTGASLGK